MPNYAYAAQTSSGEFVSGEISADRVSEAILQLEAQGLTVESIMLVAPVVDPTKQRTEFYQRIDSALQNRERLIPALAAMADEMPQKSAARDVQRLVTELRNGASAEQLLQREATASWLPLVVRGLASSSTALRFEQLIDDANREADNRRNIQSLIAYPLFLLGIGSIVMLFMMIFVVSVFRSMFLEFGLSLPAPTRLLLWFSDQINVYPLRTAIVVLVTATIGFVLIRTWVKLGLSTSLLGLLTSGNSANVTSMARFTSALAELLSIDAPLPEALRIAGRCCKHRHFRLMADRLASDIQVPGGSLQNSPVAHNFPTTVRYALQVDRGGQPNIPLLRELSNMYSDRARTRVNWSTNVFGPITIVAIGFLVFFIVISLFMPLVSLVTSLA